MCILDPTSPCNVVGGPSRPGSPSKTAFFCPAPLGRVTPNIYAKSTSPNCRIGLQAKFLLSPLTTAVNYNSGERGVSDGGGRYRRHRQCRSAAETGSAGLEIFQVTPQVQHTHMHVDLPDYSKPLFHWLLWRGFAVMKEGIRAVTHTLSKSE